MLLSKNMSALKLNLFFWFHLLCNFCIYINSEVNNQPIIGIVAQKITDPDLMKAMPEVKGKSYIAASYVKYVEMAGAQVVPVFYDQGEDEWRKIFYSVNGFLFPGGEVNLEDSGYYKLTKKIFTWAKEETDAGVIFPIFGICRGMQALMSHTCGSITPLTRTDSRNYTTTLNWKQKELLNSIYSDIPTKLREASEKSDITAHFHKYGVTTKTHNKVVELRENIDIIATSIDRNGNEFLSIIADRNYPFYGMQFHPEKPLFEWAPSLAIPHSKEAVRLSQFLINNFVDQARKNTKHHFKSFKDQLDYTIFQYSPIYTGILAEQSHTSFMQIYIF